MESMGIVRRVDDLGRIVIPKEIRNRLDIKEGEALELFVENNRLIFEKYNNSDEIAQICARWVDQYQNRIQSVSVVNGTTICVFETTHEGLKSASVKHNHFDKFNINVAICYCAKKVGFQIEGI